MTKHSPLFYLEMTRSLSHCLEVNTIRTKHVNVGLWSSEDEFGITFILTYLATT